MSVHHRTLRHRIAAALVATLAVAHAAAQGGGPSRATMEPLAGVQLSYERLGAEDSASPPGRFDASLATPAGTLRTTVHALPAAEQQFQRGDIAFELPTRVFDGQLLLRDREGGGTAAAWHGRIDPGLSAETQGEWTAVRSGQSLMLQQKFGEDHVGQAVLSRSSRAGSRGSRWDLQLTQVTGLARWSAGIDAADRSYVAADGSPQALAGLRLGTQWLLFPCTWMEARYSRARRADVEEPVSSVMLGTRFDLPRRLSLATSVEADANEQYKASLTLSVPLELR